MCANEIDAKVKKLRELRNLEAGSRFDSTAFRLTHADPFRQYSKCVTSRRLVIA